MEDKNLNIIVTDTGTQGSVAFPVSPEKLGKFISGLLGQRQTISREVDGIFDVDLSWLLHVHGLIEQRIKQQNEAARTAFKATIYYEDDLLRTIESFEALQHFSETKRVRSTAVRIEWTYVIRFPGKDLPEKQEINLRVNARGTRYFTTGLQAPRLRVNGALGHISYSIAHTERTWGDDIESILRQEIDQVTKKTKRYETYLENSLVLLGFALFLAGFLFPDYMNDRLQREALSGLQPLLATASDPAALAQLDVGQKLDLVVKLVDPRNSVHKVGIKYRVISVVAGFALLIWCIYLSDFRRSSFVTLTKMAEEYRLKILRKEQRRFLIMGLSFALSIVAGVLGNYAYIYLTK
jgi:hypothetical protein